ncbi:GPR1/FUN34/YaaH family transporter [Fundidesulfovibrio butyratiphilus]
MQHEQANPGPLGLLGFGMTTILLNIHNAGYFPLSAMILSMGIFYGGIAQIIAGILEYKRGNTFSYVAFTSFGMFWLSLVFIIMAPKWGATAATEPGFMGWYLALWGVFSLFMWVGTAGKGPVLRFVFLSLTALFFLLAAHNWTESHQIGLIAGWVGLVCGGSAMYLGMAEVVESAQGRKILPF